MGEDVYWLIIIKLAPRYSLTLLAGPKVDSNELLDFARDKVVGTDRFTEANECDFYFTTPEDISAFSFTNERENSVRTYTWPSEALLQSGQETYDEWMTEEEITEYERIQLLNRLSLQLPERTSESG